MWKINKQKQDKHVDTKNTVVVTIGEGLGSRVKWVKGVNCMVTDGN